MRRNKTSQNANIGDQGELWLASELPRGWIWQPPRRDLGKDALIVINDGSDLQNLEFSVQAKTSENPRIRGGYVVKSGVPRSSVFYWFASPLPTLVVAVDIAKRCGWYAWHLDLFDSPKEVFQSESDTLTIRIPESNRLNTDGWEAIRNRLKRHFGHLRDALDDAQWTPRLLATVNSLATAIRNLVQVANLTPLVDNELSKEEKMSILLEQLQHRNILAVVGSLLKHIRPDSDKHKQIRFWIEAYEATALKAHPWLKRLPPKGNPIRSDIVLAVAPKLVKETRVDLIKAGLDMIRLLTKTGQQ